MLDLSDPYKSIVKEHTNEIENMATECCKEVDKELGASNSQFWQGAVTEIKKLLRMHLTNRILNVRRNLGVRIFFKPTKPKREPLQAFLKKYDVISMKNPERKKMLVVQCGTYKGFDNLCRKKETKIGDIRLTFKPLHLAGYPKKSPLKNGEMIVDQSELESDDDNEKLNKDIAEYQQDILNDTDVVMLDIDEEIIDVDKIQSTDIKTCSQNSGHNKIIETIEDKREENNSNLVEAVNIEKYGNDKEKSEQLETMENGTNNCDQSKDDTNTEFEKDDVIINYQNVSTGVVIRDGETKQDKYTLTDTIVENIEETQDSPPLIEDVDNEEVRDTEDGIVDDIDEDDLEDF
ncbi:coiled-coil domain-containing protein 1-like isoform X6 [Pieris brassicae]|nr:coiled-coil domain-containing protein 1-like isoform X6 [Pieris brassicae]